MWLEFLALLAITRYLHISLGLDRIADWIDMYIYTYIPAAVLIPLILAVNIVWFIVMAKGRIIKNDYAKIFITWLFKLQIILLWNLKTPQ